MDSGEEGEESVDDNQLDGEEKHDFRATEVDEIDQFKDDDHANKLLLPPIAVGARARKNKVVPIMEEPSSES